MATNEIKSENGVKVYPIPANQFVYVDFEKGRQTDVSYQILDRSGRIIIQKSEHVVSNRLEVNVSSIPEGTYMLRVKSSSDELTKKIIISH